ncbi:MAG: MGMT family protein [Prevotellaceae bacterium]|jgi:methylated-DNA-protein-cysteine methyltransferase-like protein|nr:MGMT family protein [Prevotellaceae bacterium]
MNDDNFFEQVLAVARQIPYGRVTNYGAMPSGSGLFRDPQTLAID